jgi:hypothetical protein
MVSQAPNFDPSKTYGYLTINTSDPQPVKEALEQLWAFAVEMIYQFGDEFKSMLTADDVTVHVSGTTVILVAHLSDNATTKTIIEYASFTADKVIGSGGLAASLALETEIGVDSIISDPEFAKRAGNAALLRLNMDTNKAALRKLRSVWAQWEHDAKFDKLAMLLFHSLSVEMKFNVDNVDDRFLKEAPRRARDEMVNVAKSMWGRFSGMLEDYPIVNGLLEALEENAQCEFKFGVVSERLNLELEVYLPGLLSVWDLVTK